MKVLLNLNLIGKDFTHQNLNWQHHVNDASTKSIRANAILFKIRNYINPKILRSVYITISESHLNYFSLVWAQQNSGSIKRLIILQKRPLE